MSEIDTAKHNIRSAAYKQIHQDYYQTGFRFCFFLVLLFLFFHAVLEASTTLSRNENSPPLWQQAVKKIAAESDYWAAGVKSTVSVYNADDQALGSIVTHDELKLADGKPVWEQKSQTKKGQPGMVITMDLGIQKKPGEILAEYDSWTLLGKEIYAGTPVEIWKGVASEDPDNTATAYLNASNALPFQIIFTVPLSHLLLGTKSFSLKVEYNAVAGAWLPARAVIDKTARIFFQKRRVHIETEFSNWCPVPPS